MPRRKQARHTSVKDIRSILRLTFEQELLVARRFGPLKISKTSVSTYLLRAREALRFGRCHLGWMMTRYWNSGYFVGWDGRHARPMSRAGRRLRAN